MLPSWYNHCMYHLIWNVQERICLFHLGVRLATEFQVNTVNHCAFFCWMVTVAGSMILPLPLLVSLIICECVFLVFLAPGNHRSREARQPSSPVRWPVLFHSSHHRNGILSRHAENRSASLILSCRPSALLPPPWKGKGFVINDWLGLYKSPALHGSVLRMSRAPLLCTFLQMMILTYVLHAWDKGDATHSVYIFKRVRTQGAESSSCTSAAPLKVSHTSVLIYSLAKRLFKNKLLV